MAYKRQERGGGTSGTEIRHLLVAWLALSLAVTLLFADPFRRPEILLSPLMVWVFLGSLLTA
ncbi:MAG: hypothetical protein SV377_06790, partial [Halobacteria archaeon]|nr:hypothetical protein [Halobacteria archaeon]